MSNRYATGMGLSFRCSNNKERKWFLAMINTKMPTIINRMERFPERDLGDIIGDNIGIFGAFTRRMIVGAIHLRKVRAIEPENGSDWFTACYAEVAHMNTTVSVVLFNGNWYIVSGNRTYLHDTRLVAACVGEHASETGDDEDVKDALIKLMKDSNLDDDVVRAISSVHPELDIVGLRTIADFELACDD